MLELNNIHKYYSNGENKLHVLKGINMQVEEGRFIAIKGPSGAGKSTLLHVTGGLDVPSDGRVLLDGQSIYNLKDSLLAGLRNKVFGFIFQFYHLLPEFTVMENVILPGLIAARYKKKDLIEEAGNLLEKISLDHRLYHRPNQLSGGEQQRVAIARAIILEPRILLCDEPTGNLDSKTAQRICELLIDLHKTKKQTIIIVTHQDDIASIAEERLFIKDGRFID